MDSFNGCLKWIMLKGVTALEGNFHSFPSQPFLASSNIYHSPGFHVYKNAATTAGNKFADPCPSRCASGPPSLAAFHYYKHKETDTWVVNWLAWSHRADWNQQLQPPSIIHIRSSPTRFQACYLVSTTAFTIILTPRCTWGSNGTL